MAPQRSINESAYAAESKALNKLVADFQSIGLADVLGGLPHIALIGNQSAGKSSCVEAISGIRVPRDANTCTRCPYKIQMRNEKAAWTCRVSLWFGYGSDGHALPNPRTYDFGEVITDADRSNVEDRLRRAQIAVLRGEDVVSERGLLLAASTSELAASFKPSAPFSHNMVILDIQGSDVTDLTFVDLPGIVANEDHAIVDKLVTTHIEKGCLILVTIGMHDDVANQSALRRAKKVDPEGKRTIGVLTKPDQVQRGTEGSWLDLLNNRNEHRLKHGYFCVRNPDIQQLRSGITSAEAQEAESTFFKENEPWSTLPYGLRSRLGVSALTAALSEMLRAHINKQLPSIDQKIRENRVAIDQEMKKLPPPPSTDALSEMMRLRSDFETRLSGSPGVLQSSKVVYKALRDALRFSTPQLSHLVWSDELVEPAPEPDDSGITASGEQTPETGTYGIAASSDRRSAATIQDRLALAAGPKKVIYLHQVREIKETSKTIELPFITPYKAFLKLIEEPIEVWCDVAQVAFEEVPGIFRRHAEEIVSDLLSRFERRVAYEEFMSVLDNEITTLESTVKTQILDLVKLDDVPYTENTSDFKEALDKIFLTLTRLRRPDPALFDPPCEMTDHAKAALANLAALGIEGLERESFFKLLPADEWEEELRICATTQAYWQVTVKILVDLIPKVIRQQFLDPLPRRISDALAKELELGDRDRCARLLAEDAAIAKERERLEGELSRNVEARKAVQAFNRKRLEW